MKLPKTRIKNFFFLFLFLSFLFVLVSPVFAQQQGTWQLDLQVTEVGKNAERARQFIYWIFTHPPSYTVPVLAQIWSISRNIVYALFILVIAITGLAYIITKRSGNLSSIFSGIASPVFGISVPTLFFRIGMLIIYVTFSYITILGLIQASEITSRFFIENFQGCRLFNINFAGNPLDCKAANDPETIKLLEKNYTDFVGFKDPNILNQESANTGLFVVRATTFTYNVMAIILIIRHVVLWFLLMLSPFLALLLPFIFIRNTGYIWIGVFFQWLFYGPLVSLFIAGLSQVWIKGIPYAFNFTRINKVDSQIFPTAINILYGGPAQILSPTNSANYIDTYAEYIISLVMLWVAMLLPWLLLRIFRDYCCDILRQNNAVLMTVLDKIRGVGGPLPPTSPLISPTVSFKLPFRQKVEEVKKIDVQRLQEISRVNTNELTRSLSLSIGSLAEVARHEMNKEDNKRVTETLNRIANPYIIPQQQDRQFYDQVKKELEVRAQAGDRGAQMILSAAFKRPGVVSPIPVSREFPEITREEVYNTVTRDTSLSSEKIKEILKELPKITVENQVQVLSGKLQLPELKVQQAIDSLPRYVPTGVDLTTLLAENPLIAGEVAKRTGLSEQKVREVLEKFSTVSQDTTTSSKQVQAITNVLPDVIIETNPQILEKIASREQEKIKEVLQKTTQLVSQTTQTTRITKEEIITKVAKITNLSEEQVNSVFKLMTNRLTQVAPEQITALTEQPEVITKLAEKTGLSQETVKNIISHLKEPAPQKPQFADQVEMIAEIAQIPSEKIKSILGTVSAYNLERPQGIKPTVARKPTVSVEDYEEVKNMWINHYKLSEVPTSETIKSRKEWLEEDTSILTNVLNLLTSLDPRDKEKGMKEVATILPFLLLGGFSEAETVIYLKAKLQAAKLVQTQLEEKEKIKEEVKKEEEETLVEVPAKKGEEEPKTMEEKQKMELEFPKENKTKKPN